MAVSRFFYLDPIQPEEHTPLKPIDLGQDPLGVFDNLISGLVEVHKIRNIPDGLYFVAFDGLLWYQLKRHLPL